jgi:hypothetical protein
MKSKIERADRSQGATEPGLGAERVRKTVNDKLAERHKVSVDGMSRTAERKKHVAVNRKVHDSVFQRGRVPYCDESYLASKLSSPDSESRSLPEVRGLLWARRNGGSIPNAVSLLGHERF